MVAMAEAIIPEAAAEAAAIVETVNVAIMAVVAVEDLVATEAKEKTAAEAVEDSLQTVGMEETVVENQVNSQAAVAAVLPQHHMGAETAALAAASSSTRK